MMKRGLALKFALGLGCFLWMGCGGGGSDDSSSAVGGEAGSSNGGGSETAAGDSTDTAAGGATWGTPATISSSENHADTSALYMASPSADEAYAVWLQKDATRQRVMVSRLTSGQWATPVAIDSYSGLADGTTPCQSPRGGEPCLPSIASASAGEAFSVWEQSDGQRIRIYASRLSNNVWSSAVGIDAGSSSTSAVSPAVVSGAAGDSFSAWIESDSQSSRLRASHFLQGAWGEPATVGPVSGSDKTEVRSFSLASPGGGEAFIIWSQAVDGGAHSVYASQDQGGSWSAAVLLDGATGISDDSNDSTAEGGFPFVSSGESGTAFAVWFHLDRDGMRRVYGARFAEGAWSQGSAIDPGVNNVLTTPIVSSPSKNEAFAVWAQHDGTAKRVWFNRFVAGNWQSPRKISLLSTAEDVTNAPIIVSSTAGEAFAVWEQSDGSSRRPFATIFANDAWGTAQAIDGAMPATGVSNTFVVSGGSAHAVSGWLESDGTSTKVYGVEAR